MPFTLVFKHRSYMYSSTFSNFRISKVKQKQDNQDCAIGSLSVTGGVEIDEA